jgi:hypothetical protein
VKKEALNKAGVGYVEVFPRDTGEEIELLIQKRLGWKPPACCPLSESDPHHRPTTFVMKPHGLESVVFTLAALYLPTDRRQGRCRVRIAQEQFRRG